MQKIRNINLSNIWKHDFLLVIISGIFLGISFPPISMNIFLFMALVPYLILINKRTSLLSISRITYWTTFIFNLITIYWVGSWTKEADPFLMISGAVLLFFNPILFLIPSTLFYLTTKVFRRKIAFLLLPFFWLFYEYIYSVTDFRFPWLSLGNALSTNSILVQISEVVGVYGLSVILVYVNVFLFFALTKFLDGRKIDYFSLSFAFLLLAIPIIYGINKLDSKESESTKIKFGIIQPNLNPWNKWEEGNLDNILNLYFELSKQAINDGAEILVWPETALPVYLTIGNYERELFLIKKFLRENQVSLITGMPDATIYYDKKIMPKDAKPMIDTSRFYTSYNSILYFNWQNDSLQKYGKQKLVPFGEKVPLVEYIPFFGDLLKWNVGISSWNTGHDTTVSKIQLRNKSNIKVGGIICIESIYADYVSQFISKGAEILVIVTNDSWYGNSSGPYQHKEIATLRAVENRKFIIRCANGGISCIIDPFGRTIKKTNMFEKKYLVVEASPNGQKTFFSRYPLLFPGLSVLLVVFIIVLFMYKKYFKYGVIDENN